MVKKHLYANISDFNKVKKSCVVVKSQLYSFVCGLIVALSFKENLNSYVKKNKQFKLSKCQISNQPKSVFKILKEQLYKDAFQYLSFIPTKIKHWRKFFSFIGFNIVIFSSNYHYRIINQQYLFKNFSRKNIFLVRCDSQSIAKYHYDVIRNPCGYFEKFVCSLCFKTTNTKNSHCCKFKCYMCKSLICHDKKLNPRTTLCKKK